MGTITIGGSTKIRFDWNASSQPLTLLLPSIFQNRCRTSPHYRSQDQLLDPYLPQGTVPLHHLKAYPSTFQRMRDFTISTRWWRSYTNWLNMNRYNQIFNLLFFKNFLFEPNFLSLPPSQVNSFSRTWYDRLHCDQSKSTISILFNR